MRFKLHNMKLSREIRRTTALRMVCNPHLTHTSHLKISCRYIDDVLPYPWLLHGSSSEWMQPAPSGFPRIWKITVILGVDTPQYSTVPSTGRAARSEVLSGNECLTGSIRWDTQSITHHGWSCHGLERSTIIPLERRVLTQHDPHPPWFWIWWTDQQWGHFRRESKDEGRFIRWLNGFLLGRS